MTGRTVRRWLGAVALLGLAVALAVAYGPVVFALARDRWGPDFSYFDNGRLVTVKLHRLPSAATLDGRPDARAGGWPEHVLRSACHYTLRHLGLDGPEGGLWLARMEGEGMGRRLVVEATAGGAVVGRYRVTQGCEEIGLAVVELQAGANGLYLMDLLQPVPGAGWFVVRIYRVTD